MQSPIRKRLLEAFTNANGEFLSGQALADILGCSRTAVWKHIEELRKEGFELEAVRKKGYRIISTMDRVTENEIRLGLKTSKLGSMIQYLDTIDSTQKVAHQLAQEGCPEGTIVVAEEQTNGRGRLTRHWHSPKFTGIWMSIVLRPKLPPFKAPQFTLITAVAVVQAIEQLCDLQPEIKWPNDILIKGKKVTGILTELQADSDKIHSIIIGIGINVNQTREDFPEELHSVATSIAIENGGKLSRSILIQQILANLEKYYQIYLDKGFAPLKLLWESYAISIGKDIIARTVNEVIAGKAIGISDEGVLKIQDKNGVIHDIYSADIEVGK
ncbi:biotin--[acetyl-CoA-carboxylase] ligase [Heyndrickxia oleronia]|jgi:BirA family biotin operon repressor/biotin-[acetyl-CoA-carboxylase] ligase|uniref:biotin--[acetyl-CoA-carboxylase] ligase n=1 Tax=Heyndrickxia oleronia TaxID=38875 RepID=UPI0007173E9B|nr:biotin--[acetyl-CoA-carboxylase] ligase [Heyndrickxia oleronia]OJH18657.1 biotin--[acetyl-CoA-carboxylase] ligase [Bacillus obstructivus]MCI1592422.1 biotin--[acetyl-CoA-carboxylase] ligase [Heyndrickxia oleronia]MCI1612309.1 biotin--[acetyl-CoA-carboxylase] ligase [Heyndrickxia oleronia]MCI1745381.1 biotin--[acetyl-CoA-carboxylase] ligase [Heyndrickxia oleronia]MCI1761951.1 biotin--[acetyl-CoA-carboxylase] ligase [Heyndrickxia oleronia]